MAKQNNRIRVIENLRPYCVSTLAGIGEQSSTDHKNPLSASFNNPAGVAFGPGHVLFIADTGGHTIRYMPPDFQFVSTLVGSPGSPGNNDGKDAKLYGPTGLVADDEYLYFSQPSRHNVRVVSV